METTTPKFPPPAPLHAQKRSAWFSALTTSRFPSQSISSSSTILSQPSPIFLHDKPHPPPSANPQTPTVGQSPPGNGIPNTAFDLKQSVMHRNCVHSTDIDDQHLVACRITGVMMSAVSDTKRKMIVFCPAERVSDVCLIQTKYDQIGILIDCAVPMLPCRFVIGCMRSHDFAGQSVNVNIIHIHLFHIDLYERRTTVGAEIFSYCCCLL